MSFFSSSRIDALFERIHNHSDATQGGSSLAPVNVAVSQQATVGPSNPNTAQQTTFGVDGSGQMGFYLGVPRLDLQAPVAVTGVSGTKNDWDPSTAWGYFSTWIITPSGALTVTGLDALPGGNAFGQTLIWLINGSNANSIVLKQQNAGSSANNRFICPNAVDFTIAPLCGVMIWRDGTTQRWRVATALPNPVAGPVVQAGSAANTLINAGAAADVVITWPSAFADTSYSAAVTVGFSDATARAAPGWYLREETKTTGAITVRIANNAAVNETFVIEAVGVHN